MTENNTGTFECYQSADATQVVFDDGRGAVVSISRVVGSSTARALMRLCRNVLNRDLLDAQQELDQFGDTGPTPEETVTDEERNCAWEVSRLAQWLLENTEGPGLGEDGSGESAVDLAVRLISGALAEIGRLRQCAEDAMWALDDEGKGLVTTHLPIVHAALMEALHPELTEAEKAALAG